MVLSAVYSLIKKFVTYYDFTVYRDGRDLHKMCIRDRMYISSADFMTRNLNRRVEVACPIKDRAVKAQIWEILQLMLSDNVKMCIRDRPSVRES